MSKYSYRFEVSDGSLKMRPSGSVWAWKWGSWKNSAAWTSGKTIDADFETSNAKSGLQQAGNLLMIAVPHGVSSPFAEGLAYDKVNIHTFKKDDATGTPLPTASYHTAKVQTIIPRDFRTLPNMGTKANYSEVLLTIEASVEVAS